MSGYIDLHCHSSVSDGTLSPRELALEAKNAGLSAIALTDHDTAEGAEEFIESVKEMGIEPIAGVEISARYKTEMHIVGLMIDYKNPEFIAHLNFLKENRRDRNKKVLELMQKNGVNVDFSDIIGQKEDGGLENVGRAHIAKALVEKGYASDIQDAFDKYLKKGTPCYVERQTYSPKKSIEIIKNAGGIAILAHPYYITRDAGELERTLIELAGYGLDGFECMYSDYPMEYQQICMEIAEKTGLLKSGGSDFHAKNRPHVKLGYAGEGQRIPYEFLQKMKEARGR